MTTTSRIRRPAARQSRKPVAAAASWDPIGQGQVLRRALLGAPHGPAWVMTASETCRTPLREFLNGKPLISTCLEAT